MRGVVIYGIKQDVCDFIGIGKECGELRVQPVIVQSACDGVGGSKECSELGVEPGIVGSVRVRRCQRARQCGGERASWWQCA